MTKIHTTMVYITTKVWENPNI